MTGHDLDDARARLFVDGESRRSRRALDALLVVVGGLLALASARAAIERGPLEDAAASLASALPSWSTTLFRAAYAVGVVFVVLVVGFVVLAPRRHRALLTSLLIACGLAVGGGVVASLVVDGRWPEVLSGGLGPDDDQGYPAVAVAALSAVLLVLRPWLVMPLRRLAAMLVAVLCVAAWVIGLTGLSGVLGAFALGAVAAGLALLLVGSPAGHPDVDAVATALDDLGFRIASLDFVAEQPWGARILEATAENGERLLVKVYGKDAVEAHRAARLWRGVVYRDQAMPGATRLQLVEHEALVTLLAERTGARTTPVLAAAASRGDALIVLGAPPPSLAAADEQALDDATLSDLWTAVARLHEARLCHGELTLEHVGVAGGHVVLSDFAGGSVAATPERRAQETATLLTSVALRVGTPRAVGPAVAVLGEDAVGRAQPYLQRAALPRSLRAAPGLKAALASLNKETPERTGVPAAPPAPIVRVRWRDLLQNALVLLAAYGLVTVLAQLDWDVVLRSWADASWSWIVVGLLVAQLSFAADSVSTMSAVSTRLPLLPLVHLQYAIKLVAMAVSTTASKVALNTSFLRRFGETATVAVTASSLDSAAGAIANVGIVALALLIGSGDAADSLQLGSGEVNRMLWLLAAVLVISVLVVAFTPRLRRWVTKLVASAWAALRVVTSSPARALVLLGSNVVSLLIAALALYCMVDAIGPPLSLGTVVAVTAAAATFTSMVPVPGGVGVGEAALAAALGAAGVPTAQAFAIAVTQRIATSYLPVVVGVYSSRWLRRGEYL